MAKKNKYSAYIEDLREYKKTLLADINHAMSQYDKLILTLSSGALAISMTFLSSIVDLKDIETFMLLKISWILWGSSLFLSLTGQYLSYKVHDSQRKCNNRVIEAAKLNKSSKKLVKIQESNQSGIRALNISIEFCNIIAALSFISGIILFTIFVSQTL